MNAYPATQTIISELASILPPLFTAAGLDDLSLYSSDKPKTPQQTALVCYIDYENDDSETHTIGVIIQVQLYAVSDSVAGQYHEVIFPAIRNNIAPDLLGFDTRLQIASDIYPIDQRGSGFLFYGVEFSRSLDDCS